MELKVNKSVSSWKICCVRNLRVIYLNKCMTVKLFYDLKICHFRIISLYVNVQVSIVESQYIMKKTNLIIIAFHFMRVPFQLDLFL